MVTVREFDLLRHFGLGDVTTDGILPVRRISAPPGWDGVIAFALLFARTSAARLNSCFIELPACEWSRRIVSLR